MKILNNGCLDVKEIPIAEQETILSFDTELPMDTVIFADIAHGSNHTVQQLVFTGNGKFSLHFDVTKEIYSAKSVVMNLNILAGTQLIGSDPVAIVIDHKRIAATSLINKQPELIDLYIQLAELKRQFTQYAKGFVNPTLKPFDKTLTRKGMVYAIIDDAGNAAFIDEFLAFIKSVNGLRTINGSVTLEAKHIRTESNRTIDEEFAYLRSEIRGMVRIIGESLKNILDTTEALNTRVYALEMDKIDKESGVI